MPIPDSRVIQFRDSFLMISDKAGAYYKDGVRDRQKEMAELMQELLDLRATLRLKVAQDAQSGNYTVLA